MPLGNVLHCKDWQRMKSITEKLKTKLYTGILQAKKRVTQMQENIQIKIEENAKQIL